MLTSVSMVIRINVIVNFRDLSDDMKKLAGGKGASLAMLLNAGLPVPDGFVILSSGFENGALTSTALSTLKSFISELSENCTYAVRSSATGEDSENASFAGAYETVLDVKKSDITDAVEKVAKSADSQRVRLYAENRRIDAGKIAVVVQSFVKPHPWLSAHKIIA